MAIQLKNKLQCVNCGNILQPTENATVCCWFYNTNNSTYQMLFGREDNAGTQPGYHLEINTSQKGAYHSDHGPNMVYTTTTIALNTWYHMAGVRDSVAGVQKIYLNGVQEGSNANGVIDPVTSEFQIGQTLGWPGQGFVGILDDMRVYDRALNSSEIETIYACRSADTIVNGLQGRWMFVGPEEQGIGSFSSISVNNVQSSMSTSAASSITLAYTVPTGSNLVLVVAATAEDAISSRVRATNVTFNGNVLSNITSVATTTSLYNGVSLWRKSVTSGESGNIVVTWSAANDRRTVFAYVLSNAQNVVEVSATSFNNTGVTTTGLTTISDNALVVTAGVNKDGYVMTAVGTNHVVDSSIVAGEHAGAIGHVSVPIAGSISGIGFTASPTPTGEALILAAFTPVNVTEQSVELSNNEFIGTAINVPIYKSTFLKNRRSLYSK